MKPTLVIELYLIMTKRLYRRFSEPRKLAILNGVLLVILVGLNAYFQVFCIPTTWAVVVLAICFTNTIIYPVINNTQLASLSGFLNGVSLFVFIYCIIFLEHLNFLGILAILIGLGLAVFIPHFFVIQLIWRNIFRPVTKTSRYFFLIALILCSGVVVYSGQEYKKAIGSIEKFKKSGYQELEKTFMTEKILGMHFIYHTRFCEFDGWRPPKHEPIMIMGMWLNNRYDPLQVDLKTRLKLYKKFFPDEKYKFSCSCGIIYSNDYHKDNLWK